MNPNLPVERVAVWSLEFRWCLGVVSVVSALNGDPMGDLVLWDFPGPGCPVLFPLGLAIVFGLFCTGVVKYVTVPLVFGRGRLPIEITCLPSELCIWSKLMVVSNRDWIDSVYIFKRIRRCRGFAIQDASGLC